MFNPSHPCLSFLDERSAGASIPCFLGSTSLSSYCHQWRPWPFVSKCQASQCSACNLWWWGNRSTLCWKQLGLTGIGSFYFWYVDNLFFSPFFSNFLTENPDSFGHEILTACSYCLSFNDTREIAFIGVCLSYWIFLLFIDLNVFFQVLTLRATPQMSSIGNHSDGRTSLSVPTDWSSLPWQQIHVAFYFCDALDSSAGILDLARSAAFTLEFLCLHYVCLLCSVAGSGGNGHCRLGLELWTRRIRYNKEQLQKGLFWD